MNNNGSKGYNYNNSNNLQRNYNYNVNFQQAEKYIENKFWFHQVPVPNYNKQVLRRVNTNSWDIDKAHYKTDELIREEEVAENIKDQFLFERQNVSILKFHLHFMEGIDWLFLVLAIIGIFIGALASPLLSYLNSIIFSNVGNTSENRQNLTAEEIMKLNVKEQMNSNIKKQLIFGSIELVGNIMGYGFFGLLSKRCIYNFKKKYFSIILSQEQAFFDSANVFEFATKIQTQIEYIELGLGSRLGNILMDFFIGIASFIFAFFGSWKLALVLLCFSPLSFLISIIFNRINVSENYLVLQTWELAGGIAEEILYNIRTVVSFANFDYELKRFYEDSRITNEIELMANCKTKFLSAVFVIIEGLIIFIGIIYGRTLIKKDFNSFKGRDLTGGDVSLTFNNISTCVSSIGKFTNSLQYIQLALAATSDYFNLYERKPEMDLTNSKEKPPLSEIKGKVEYKNVEFYYPSDEHKKIVLNGLTFTVQPGQKVALVGESGCGKTTTTLLLERLYDVTGGEILIDGIDIRKYDIQYLRNIIGYVGQNPVLFNTTIRNNIIFGSENYLAEIGGDVDQLINDACEQAYVNEFIHTLPNELDFVVGLKGNKLSLGQKQRIALARAILSKPKVLILDEATSALDNKSEKMIAKALDNISKLNITTITIAHRFLTIKDLDLIYLIKDGKIYDQGTHEELLKKGGYYCDIIRTRLIKDELDVYHKKDKIQRKKTILKTERTIDKYHLEKKEKEISKSPSDIHLGFLTLLRDLWINYRVNCILAFLAAIVFGVIPCFKGFIKGECTKSLNSNYETKRYDDSLKYSIIFIILVVGESIFNFLENWLFYRLGIKLAKFYRNQTMRKYLSFHLSFYDLERNFPGTILTNLSLNTIQMKKIVSDTIGSYIMSFSIIITCIILGCIYEYRLTLIAIGFLIFLLIINLIRKSSMPSDKKKHIRNIEAGTIISESFTNTKTIFAYNFQTKARDLYLRANDYILRQQVINEFINGLIIGLTLFANFAKNAALFAATKRYVLNDSMDSDDLTVVQAYTGSGFTKISHLMRDLGNIKKGKGAVQLFYSVINTKSLIPHFEEENLNKIPPYHIKGKIEFKHVYFSYPLNPERIVLKDINLTIMPGEKVALVGYSGSGKSCLISLINRFYDVEPDWGEILIDDVNIKDYNLYELRKKIGFVQQEPSIFKTSILDNIRYGKIKATDEECIEAAKKTDILPLLEKDNTDESSDENHHKKILGLSSGEKQKIAVTRIVLKDPVILLLDGVTTTLDKDSEMDIQKSLFELSKNRTTIIISDKFNVVRKCDKIIVLDRGRIVEQGTHEELMKLEKRYYTIYKFSNDN